jgi:hypothetical protein
MGDAEVISPASVDVGITMALASVIGWELAPPPTHPVSVIVRGGVAGAAGVCANAADEQTSAIPQIQDVFMIGLLGRRACKSIATARALLVPDRPPERRT